VRELPTVGSDGCDGSIVDALGDDDREELLERALYCEFCHRVYPLELEVGVSGATVMCVHCYFEPGFGQLTDEHVANPDAESELARGGVVRYVERFAPAHDSTTCWHPRTCFLCDARAASLDVRDADAVAAWLAAHHYAPEPPPGRPFAYVDSAKRRIRHLASGLELVVVTTQPWFALGAAPVTRCQAARLRGDASTTGDDAPWTGFDLEELRGLYCDGLRLPTASERAAALRAGALVGIPGIDELTNVTAYAIEILSPPTGAIISQPIADLARLDSIGRPIPHPVPPTVAVRLALGEPDAVGQR
jgi:hypothetical protein